MEVLVGPTFTINVPSSPPPAGNSGERLFLNGVNGYPEEVGSAFRISGSPKFLAGGSSESENSSSIGTPDESDNEEEEEEVQSKLKRRSGLGSVDALEDSLPIKRGLSSHFDGKSKSFTDLSQVSTLKEIKELKKQESPFNKRRRVLIASKWSRKSAFYSWSNPKSMPLLPVSEDQDYDDDDDYEENDEEQKARKVPSASSSSSSSLAEEKKQEEDQVQLRHSRITESYAAAMRLRLGTFKSKSFSLADLQEHDEEDDDD